MFTFKKEPKDTGLRSVGHPHPNTEIKHQKKVCGCIYAPSWSTEDSKWSIGLIVADDQNPNCDWKWIRLKARFDTEPEARAWLLANAKLLFEKYTIRCHDG